MKKHKLKSALIAGVLAAAFTLGAAAGVGVQKINATLRPDITIEVEGAAQALYDKNGDVVYPIEYNGSTYVPIRAVGTLLSQDVLWDSKSKTVSLSAKQETSPEELTHSALTERVTALQESYDALYSDIVNTEKAARYAENLTIFHRLNNRRIDLTATLRTLQVDLSEAYRSEALTKTQFTALEQKLDNLDNRLSALEGKLTEKYGIDKGDVTEGTLRAAATALKNDLTSLKKLTSAVEKAADYTDWKSADETAQAAYRELRSDVTALALALNESLRQSDLTFAQYNALAVDLDELDNACKEIKARLDKAEAAWSKDETDKPVTDWSDKDTEAYTNELKALQDKADELFAQCRDYFTDKTWDAQTGASLMRKAEQLEALADALEDAVERSRKLNRQDEWKLLLETEKVENTLDKAENFLEKAGIDDNQYYHAGGRKNWDANDDRYDRWDDDDDDWDDRWDDDDDDWDDRWDDDDDDDDWDDRWDD